MRYYTLFICFLWWMVYVYLLLLHLLHDWKIEEHVWIEILNGCIRNTGLSYAIFTKTDISFWCHFIWNEIFQSGFNCTVVENIILSVFFLLSIHQLHLIWMHYVNRVISEKYISFLTSKHFYFELAMLNKMQLSKIELF